VGQTEVLHSNPNHRSEEPEMLPSINLPTELAKQQGINHIIYPIPSSLNHRILKKFNHTSLIGDASTSGLQLRST
jgi:hypothetical protein